MAENSQIAWTDHTFNPWRGCQHATLPDGNPHPGCLNCYAENWSRRNPATLGQWGNEDEGGARVMAAPKMWAEPRRWNARAEQDGQRERVFCASLADVFEEWGGLMVDHRGQPILRPPLAGQESYIGETTMGDARRQLYALWDETPWLDWLVLTKRPQNAARMLDKPRPNVWIGTSVSDQATANALTQLLLLCRQWTPVLFLSAEPLLGPIDLAECGATPDPATGIGGVDWVIAGGESEQQHEAAPYDLDWARQMAGQCAEAGIAFFHKQAGSTVRDRGQPVRYKHRKGENPAEWPKELQIRQHPEARP